MKNINIIFTVFLCLILGNVKAQNHNQCGHCGMDILDNLHTATAVSENETIQFDAIECLINYLKKHDESTFLSLKVADYKTGKLTNAKTATYLKSKAIPSPMGAFLSAFSNKEDALKTKKEKGGTIYTWKEIKVKFEKSNFGILHHHHNHYRPDAHAPIGIMGDHLHEKGGLMVSVRYMNMAMEGNKAGINTQTNAAIFNNYMVAPQKMTMDMYMLGVMYAPTNKLTLMAMQNVVKKDMDLTNQMMMGGMIMKRNFSTSASGIGDLQLNALYGLFSNHISSLHLNGGVSIPTGDIKQTDDTPMENDAKLPYAMQLGSGTFDFTLGATYKKNYNNLSWGVQALSTFRTGENTEDYRLGDLHQLNIWGAYCVTKNISLSSRVLGISETKIIGTDAELKPMMVTTANAGNYGSTKVKSFVGVNISFPQTSSMKNFRFGVEGGIPVSENYNGIQMDEGLSILIGLKYFVL